MYISSTNRYKTISPGSGQGILVGLVGRLGGSYEPPRPHPQSPQLANRVRTDPTLNRIGIAFSILIPIFQPPLLCFTLPKQKILVNYIARSRYSQSPRRLHGQHGSGSSSHGRISPLL